jgi:small-conductance mechanosensitive channel
MASVSRRIGWEMIKGSFLSVLAFLFLFMSYIYYRINILPVISDELHLELKRYIGTLFVVSIAFVLSTVFSAAILWYKANMASRTTTRLDDKLIPIANRTLKLLICIIALLIILPFFGVNISALIAALGVGSLAIALAAQDTIANIIAGFMIMIDSPFEIGDRIKLPSGETVEVLDIGVRRSEFLSEDKAIVIVPNLDLSKSKIVNYTYGKKRQK